MALVGSRPHSGCHRQEEGAPAPLTSRAGDRPGLAPFLGSGSRRKSAALQMPSDSRLGPSHLRALGLLLQLSFCAGEALRARA